MLTTRTFEITSLRLTCFKKKKKKKEIQKRIAEGGKGGDWGLWNVNDIWRVQKNEYNEGICRWVLKCENTHKKNETIVELKRIFMKEYYQHFFGGECRKREKKVANIKNFRKWL